MTSPAQKAALSSTRAARSTTRRTPAADQSGRYPVDLRCLAAFAGPGDARRLPHGGRRARRYLQGRVLDARARRRSASRRRLCVFDAAVNSGVGQAGVWLQNALGDHYVGTVDGVIGAKTMQAVADYGDPDSLIEAYCSHRLATLQHLKTWATFGAGWHARIANVQKTACAWNDSAPTPQATVTGLGGHQKATVGGNIRPPAVSQIAAHITTAATGAGTIASLTAQQITALQDTFSWLKSVFGGLTLMGCSP